MLQTRVDLRGRSRVSAEKCLLQVLCAGQRLRVMLFTLHAHNASDVHQIHG